MTARKPASEIDAEAATWAARIDAGDLSPEAESALEAWLAADRRGGGALLRAQATLSLLDRGRALAGGEPAPDTQRRLTIGRRAAIAAGVAGLAAGGGIFFTRGERQHRYATALGEIRRVPLADGSVAAINTDTVLDVTVTSTARRVKLDRGEAWFQVAKDAERPFVVEAGAVRVRAVGTAFSVRALADGAEVAVTEGVVETWAEGSEHRKLRMEAGAQAFVSPEQPAQATAAAPEIDRKLAWREGQIALDGETLATAAAEFNRYNVRKIVIDDPTLASEGLVGFFSTGEPESFARAAAATLDAKVAVDAETIRLFR